MKNAEFMELLNLYLDHEILAADAARLEIEVQTNPERRRIYQQYCQMQKACKMLVADFQDTPTTVSTAEGKRVVPFQPAPSRRVSVRPVYVFGAVAAAAACVAFVFSGGRPEAGMNEAAPGQDRVAITTPVQSGPASPISAVEPGRLPTGAVAGGIVHRPMLVNDPLLLGGTSNLASGFASSVAPSNDELAWVRTLRLAPLQPRLLLEDLKFEAQPAALRPEARALGIKHTPSEEPSEMAAFRFTK